MHQAKLLCKMYLLLLPSGGWVHRGRSGLSLEIKFLNRKCQPASSPGEPAFPQPLLTPVSVPTSHPSSTHPLSLRLQNMHDGSQLGPRGWALGKGRQRCRSWLQMPEETIPGSQVPRVCGLDGKAWVLGDRAPRAPCPVAGEVQSSSSKGRCWR